MKKAVLISLVKKLFEDWASEPALEVNKLPASGSNRKYLRVKGKNKNAVAAFNPDKRENEAFIYLTKHFSKTGLNVPAFYSYEKENGIFLLQDLGDETLYDKILNEEKISEEVVDLYKKAINHLIKFQIDGTKGLDFSYCYPRSSFDEQSIKWDLNYFKYYFLKLSKVQFDEQKLEDDFSNLTNYLLQAESNYFLYRDFQSRNIMLCNDELFFIDYQGGRKGALQYDAASLLFQAKVNLPSSLKDELLDYYLERMTEKIKVDKYIFKKFYFEFALLRILQTLGAYGFRGYYERKPHFLSSIPFAVKNVKQLIDENKLHLQLPELFNAVEKISLNNNFNISNVNSKKLKVTINSFSYKNGFPPDKSGNGGGFVFDCRSLNNPGRYEEYKNLTGKDKSVIEFLETKSRINDFLEDSFTLIKPAIENYVERKFKNLSISFGCTGGQHRSVYCAEKFAEKLKSNFDIDVHLVHNELNNEDI